MGVYRVNLYNTFENVIKRKAFSTPSSTHSLYGELSDLSNWGILEKIKKGNVLLLCRGIRFIWGIAYATDDCKITDIDSFKYPMKFEEFGYRYISIDIYKEFTSPIDGKKLFHNLLLSNPFEDPHFCVQLKELDDKKLEFNKTMNKLLES